MAWNLSKCFPDALHTYSYVGTAFRLEKRTLVLTKMDRPLKVRWSRPLEGKPTTVTVSKDSADRYFVSFSCETPDLVPLPKSNREVGVDMGLTHFATLSTGEKVKNPRHLQRDLKKLKRAQQALAALLQDVSVYHGCGNILMSH